MNTRKLFFGLCAALALAGCSSEDTVSTDKNQTINGETRYLTVNIISTPANGTRAGDNQESGQPGNATYEEGYAAENYVKNVRFYFFDANGREANVKSTANGSVNYFDWDKVENPTSQNMPNVEKILNAVIVINPNDKLPTSMVAIVNPDIAKLGDSPLTLEQLREMSDDYLNNKSLDKTATSNNNPFLMSSTVYAENGKKMNEVSIDGHICQTEEAAKVNPVDMYVERVLAKVVFSQGTMTNTQVSAADDATYIKAKNSAGKDIETVDGSKIYIKLIGWNVTANIDQSYLIKNINPSTSAWDDTKNWGTTNGSWNYPAYYRSFWAVNPDNAEVKLPSIDQNDKGGYGNYEDACSIKDFNDGVTYCQENAANYYDTGTKDNATTKVIIGAELYRSDDGKSFEKATIYQYAGKRYVDEEACKTAMLNAASVEYYKKNENGEDYTKITAADVDLKTAIEAGAVTAYQDKGDGTGSYKSYLVKKNATDTWYTVSDDEQKATVVAEDDIKKKLIDAAAAQVFNEGKSYFYFDIQHLGYGIENVDFGWYGVVRNHIYRASITGITGLGTPVPDDGKITIVPEKPDDEVYVAARIQILSWRIVPNEIELKW